MGYFPNIKPFSKVVQILVYVGKKCLFYGNTIFHEPKTLIHLLIKIRYISGKAKIDNLLNDDREKEKQRGFF